MMCTEFPLGGKAGRRHSCDRGCRTGLQTQRQGAPRLVECWLSVRASQFVHWSVIQATVSISLSSAKSEAKAITKGCIEALYVKHLLEHQTARPFNIELWTDSSSAKVIMQRLGPGRRATWQPMWVQQLNKIGLISLNTFPDEETQKFQVYMNINQERLPVFDDGENESLEEDVHSFVNKTSHLTTAALRRGVVMNIL